MNTSEIPRTIRILISSPGDVAEERDRARQVIDSLRRRYGRQFLLRPVLWEDLALQVDTSFQAGIDVVLSTDHGIDIAVFILWSRLGSAVGPQIKKEDGREYRSGTERELDLMLNARKQSGGLRPCILAYTREDETCFEERLRGKPTTEKEELIAQKKLVEAFIEERFRDSEHGHNTGAFHSFDRPVKFSQRLRIHLIDLLDQLAGETTETIWDIDKQGPPYLGLNAFQPEHRDIFFGREEETIEVRFSLRERAKQGCAFLLLTGASGSGKSSLARSGVLPDIVQNELDDHVVSWRSLIITPAELTRDPLLVLLQRLACPEIWPDLRRDDASLEKLARGLRENPELTIDIGIQPAIDQISARERGSVRLLLLIDQMEEIFATHVMTQVDRAAFLRAIEAFARCGSVWVLATARSDFFHQIQGEPTLVRLLEGRGPMPVLPPGPDSLQRLIEEPARLAGLRFESRDGISLASRILRDAVAHSELLPLLEFLLRELYEKSNKTDRLLTLNSYDELGGIEGAVGKQAEEAFQSLSIESQTALIEILPLLVTVEIAGEQSAVRRRAPLKELQSTEAKRKLTDCLISKRFLTADRQDQLSVVSFTHEALLRRWDRISGWINTNREHLRIRSRVFAAVTNWEKQQHRSDLLLSRGKPLDEANELMNSQMALEPAVIEFISQSRRRAKWNLRIRRLAIASLFVLTLVSVIMSITAWQAQGQASQAKGLAEKRAEELTQQVYDNSIAIAEREISQNHDIGKASNLLEGGYCPELLRGWEWHYLMRLRDGERQPLKGHQLGLWGAEFSPDGRYIATCSIDGTLKFWDGKSGELVRSIDADKIDGMSKLLETFNLPRIAIMCLAFNPDGKTIATGSFYPKVKFNPNDIFKPIPDRDSPGLFRIWDVESGTLISEFSDQQGVALALTYSPDGKRIASSTINSDHSFVVWDVATHTVVKRVLGHNSHVHRLRFTPDGKILATSETDGIVKLWNAETFEQIHSIKAHAAPAVLSFSPRTGAQFATAGQDGLVRVWDTKTAKQLMELEGHAGAALDVRYSPDETRIASTGLDKTIRLWDASTGNPKITLRGHTELVWSVAFSPDGHRLLSCSFDRTARIWDATPVNAGESRFDLTASGHSERVNTVCSNPQSDQFATGGWDKVIRIWDAQTGEAVSTLEGHQAVIWCVTYRSDGLKLASASWDHTAKVWDLQTGKEEVTFTGHTAPVHSIAFSPDGKRLATGSFDAQLKIWNSSDGKVITSCDGFIFPVLAVTFSPDGKYVASGGSDRKATVWDANSGKTLLTLAGHAASIHGIAYSPDGTRIATASWDHTVRIWDASLTGKAPPNRELFQCKHGDRVNSVVFSPDGKQLATASEDKTVRIWDAASGNEVHPSQRHRSVVFSAAFTKDGGRLISASWEKPDWIHTWKIK